MKPKINSTLTDVPETMLWTLHNRAEEALRSDGIIKDQTCIDIYQSIDYDYENSFGKAEPSHALRSIKFDNEICKFLDENPHGTIVNLGEGLETQRYRIKEDNALWLSVDVPEAIQIREQFIQPDDRHLHCPISALDRTWFEQVRKDQPVLITAQGLFMYLPVEEVKSLFQDIFNFFPGGILVFDTIPVWLSKKTLSHKGWQRTKAYTTPPMPWGINRNELQDVFQSWSNKIINIDEIAYLKDIPRGSGKVLVNIISALPYVNRFLPTAVKINFSQKIRL